ncbi:MAG: biopolymer transporter ExbD [Bacteroidia bacterium]
MADVGGGGGEDHGKHGKKGRKKGGNPRVDMTPMVDLAFLLLTFFVLTSNLNKAKTMEMAVPKEDTEVKTQVDSSLANTILLDGNKEGVLYVYHGKFNSDPAPALNEFKFDAKNGIRQYILSQNTKVSSEMKYLRTVYKSGKLGQDAYVKVKGILAEKAQAGPLDDSIIVKRKKEDYAKAMTRLDRDLIKNEMTDTTFKIVAANIRDDAKAPFFIVKWCGDAKYGDVINIIDELKIADVSKYAITKVSRPELQALSGKTGTKYPELSEPDPGAQPAAPPKN